jgi:hypothetical protein
MRPRRGNLPINCLLLIIHVQPIGADNDGAGKSLDLLDLSSSEADRTQIDLTGVQPSIDKVAADVARDNKLINDALLGYAKIDLLHMRLTFGHWNSREIDHAEVKKFVASMKTGKGFIRYTTETMVPLAISKSAVDLTSLSAEPGLGEDILLDLVLKDQQATVYAAGGQHRRAALQVFERELMKQIAALGKKIKAAKDAAPLKASEEQLMADLAAIGLWGVAVYDLGEPAMPLTQTHSQLSQISARRIIIT